MDFDEIAGRSSPGVDYARFVQRYWPAYFSTNATFARVTKPGPVSTPPLPNGRLHIALMQLL